MSLAREEVLVAIGDAAEPVRGAFGVSWGSIFAGAAAAAAISLMMVALGSGLGLTMVSPWAGEGVEVSTFAVSSGVWLIIIQLVAAVAAGYLAGRLRAGMDGYHSDEVFFRDTAHGFLAWAVATLIVAGLLTSALTSLVAGAAQSATTIAGGAATGASQGAAESAGDGDGNPSGYLTDLLFRPASETPLSLPGTPEATGGEGASQRSEASRLLMTAVTSGELSADDRAYLGRMVANRTGLSQPDAEARVQSVMQRIETAKTEAKATADEARKAAAAASFFTALSLLIGAFVAAAAAAIGGRQRDGFELATSPRKRM